MSTELEGSLGSAQGAGPARGSAALPLVSVVTIFYNRGAYAKESIRSLLDQSYPNLEIVAVDDGSTDDTLAALRSLEDPRYRVIEKPNTGFTTSLIHAISQTKGEYIALLDAGDTAYPERIAKQVAVLQSQPEVGIVGCWVEDENDFGEPTTILKPERRKSLRETLKSANTFTHGEVTYRRALYDKVGGYRTFFTFAQDIDLWIRMSEHCDFAIIPEVLYVRRRIMGGVSTSPDKLMAQAYLADFARQCAANRFPDGRDFIDRYGPQAAFFRQASPALAKKFGRMGVHWFLERDRQVGMDFLDQAAREAPSASIAIKRFICGLSRYPLVWRLLLRPLLTRYRRAHMKD